MQCDPEQRPNRHRPTPSLQARAEGGRAARRWEPKRLRLRIFSLAGRLARSARRTVLHLPAHAPWAGLLLHALTTLRALTAPG